MMRATSVNISSIHSMVHLMTSVFMCIFRLMEAVKIMDTITRFVFGYHAYDSSAFSTIDFNPFGSPCKTCGKHVLNELIHVLLVYEIYVRKDGFVNFWPTPKISLIRFRLSGIMETLRRACFLAVWNTQEVGRRFGRQLVDKFRISLGQISYLLVTSQALVSRHQQISDLEYFLAGLQSRHT